MYRWRLYALLIRPTEPTLRSSAPAESHHFSEYAVFCMLDTIRPTSCGLDMLPGWFLRMAAPSFALALIYLYNLSIEDSIVPYRRKTIVPLRRYLKRKTSKIARNTVRTQLPPFYPGKWIRKSSDPSYAQCFFTQTMHICSMISSHLDPQLGSTILHVSPAQPRWPSQT